MITKKLDRFDFKIKFSSEGYVTILVNYNLFHMLIALSDAKRRRSTGLLGRFREKPVVRSKFAYQESISSTFYLQVLCTKVIFSPKYNKKGVQKMLMKLTPGVNFINVLRSPFSYESIFDSFSLVLVWL